MSATDQPTTTDIPLTPVQRAVATTAHDPPYRAFIFASLALGLGGGFMLALMLPLARAAQWRWAEGSRYPALVQDHGQLQLMGFAGLFIMGMSLRLMPRFSRREVGFAAATPWLIVLVASSLIMRSLAEPAADSPARGVALLASAVLLLVAALVFVAVVFRTLMPPPDADTRTTAIFFSLGSLGYLAGAIINLVQMYTVARHGLDTGPAARQTALVFTQQYGFTFMFIAGVGTRALPTLSGHPRRNGAASLAAAMLVAGIVMFAGATLWSGSQGASTTAARIGDAGLIATGVAFALIVYASGALRLGPNRVAAASQAPFWLARSAMVWMLVAGVLSAWYGVRAFNSGGYIDQFALDAIRHALTIGVLTMMIIGMALLIVPEFAGRRLQHPDERRLVYAMLIALNAAVVLRIWPALEGIGWLAHTRYWPMSLAGALAIAVIALFAAMFAQSYVEQRAPGWATPRGLAARKRV